MILKLWILQRNSKWETLIWKVLLYKVRRMHAGHFLFSFPFARCSYVDDRWTYFYFVGLVGQNFNSQSFLLEWKCHNFIFIFWNFPRMLSERCWILMRLFPRKKTLYIDVRIKWENYCMQRKKKEFKNYELHIIECQSIKIWTLL